jgi:hypothetical protein
MAENQQTANQNAAEADELLKEATGKSPGGKTTTTTTTQTPSGWTQNSVYITSAGVMVFSLIVMGMMTFLILKKHPPGVILRTFAIPLIAVLAVLLIIIGYAEQQIAPAIGLLGTIAGFLLNRGENKSSSGEESKGNKKGDSEEPPASVD